MELWIIILAAVYGAVAGSFLNCAAWRTARGESFISGHSRCTACGHELGAPDLVPVLSWLFLRGRCRFCGEKISARYPLTELFWAAVTVLCLEKFGLTVLFARNYIFLCCLFVLSLVDQETMLIPDECHLIAAGTWLISLPLPGAVPRTCSRMLPRACCSAADSWGSPWFSTGCWEKKASAGEISSWRPSPGCIWALRERCLR